MWWILALVVAVGVGLVLLWARKVLSAARDRAIEVAPGAILVDERANCFGVASAGVSQIRGNGTLALTGQELVFVQAVPQRTIRITRSAIIGVRTQRSFLGKSKGMDLLVVSYATPAEPSAVASGEDEAAWLVADLPAWLIALT